MQDKKAIKAKLDDITKEDYEQWASLKISKLFFGEFLDEISDIIEEKKVNLPVDQLTDQEIATQMRALAVVEIFLDSFREAKNYDEFIGTFDLGEENEN